MKLARLFSDFFDSEKAGGLILVFVTLLSFGFANSPWQTNYINFWHTDIAGHGIVHWINDGLMAIFFLLIGLELEREIYNGELSNLKNASLPIFGAIGGMIIPAVIDDLGAIIVIAIFYTTSIAFISLFIALAIFCLLLILKRLKVQNLIPYLIGGE